MSTSHSKKHVSTLDTGCKRLRSILFNSTINNWKFDFYIFSKLARLRRPPAAFLLNGAITRPATGSITFEQPFRGYMQSFIKIRGTVLEKNADNAMTLCNFNEDWILQKLKYTLSNTFWRYQHVGWKIQFFQTISQLLLVIFNQNTLYYLLQHLISDIQLPKP